MTKSTDSSPTPAATINDQVDMTTVSNTMEIRSRLASAGQAKVPDKLSIGEKNALPPKPTRRGRPRKSEENEFNFPVEPKTLQVVKKPRTTVNHSYRDFSRVPPELSDETPKLSEMTFSQKLHEILSTKDYEPYVCWMPHGRAFRVNVPKRFESKVCPKYFGHSRYSSFLRQLNNYGFKHITHGPDRNCYYHECFLRGLPHLCKYMPKPRNARRLIPDPENEPNFYQICQSYPIPDQEDACAAPGTHHSIAPPATAMQEAGAKPLVSSMIRPAMEVHRPEASRLHDILGLNQSMLNDARSQGDSIDQNSYGLAPLSPPSFTTLASLQALQCQEEAAALRNRAAVYAANAARSLDLSMALRRLPPSALAALSRARTQEGASGINYPPNMPGGANMDRRY